MQPSPSPTAVTTLLLGYYTLYLIDIQFNAAGLIVEKLS